MQRFYREYYKKYIQALQNAADKADRALLTKAYQTAAVLFEVLKAVNVSQSVEVDQAILDTHNKVEEKKRRYVPYNILPLDPESTDQPIMRYPEIQAAVYALRNIRGLPWPKEHEKKPDEKKTDKDLLDWLQAMFGFQKDNVSNQREHLILLLANVHIRQIPKPDQQPKLDDRALDAVMKKLFKNYKKWCKYLGRKSSLWKSSSAALSMISPGWAAAFASPAVAMALAMMVSGIDTITPPWNTLNRHPTSLGSPQRTKLAKAAALAATCDLERTAKIGSEGVIDS